MNSRVRQIWNIALPSIISNITVPLLGLVDVAIVGHIGDAKYISAIAVGTMLFNVIYWVFGFLRMGTGGMTSQCYGRRDFHGVLVLLKRTLILGGGIGALFILFQSLIIPFGLWLMSPEDDMVDLCRRYCYIVIWGAPAMLSLYGLTGWFVGMQNTRFPMIVSVSQNIVNIISSLLFVFVFRLDISGVAYGTLASQWFGFFIAVLLIATKYRRLWKYWRKPVVICSFDAYSWKRFFMVNRDIFLRTVFLVSVFLFFTSAGSRQGSLVLAANTLLMEFFTLFSYFTDGFAYAGEALGGRYYGSGNKVALRDVVNRLFLLGGVIAFIFTVMYIFGGRAFLSLLTDDFLVVDEAMSYFWWAVMIPFAGVTAFLFDGIFIGITDTKTLLMSSVIAALCFFAVYFVTKPIMANHGLWLAFIVYLSIRGVVEWIVYIRK